MGDSEHINAILESQHPGAYRCLSALGRRSVFPRGILAQSAEAKGCDLKATIGQITNGRGDPLPLPSMRSALDLNPRVSFLYSPQPGQPTLRTAWSWRQREISNGSEVPASLPLVTHGLTQGLGLVADMFADADTEVIIPSPFWGNYRLIFTHRHGAKLRLFPFFTDQGFNLQGLADTLDQVTGKAVIILNIPGNPTGYTPGREMAARIAEVVAAHPGPAVVVVDDAYQGMLWEDGLSDRSLYWDIADKADPERQLVIKLDGATKEFFFFPGRIGFLTHSAQGEAADMLENKLKCLGRATVGSPPGPSQALLLKALQTESLQTELDANLAVLKRRYRALKNTLKSLDNDKLFPYPFNSGMFALVGLDPQLSPERVRKRLIAEHSMGVISIPSVNGLRIAYGATDEADLPRLVAALDEVVRTYK